ncbi:MAG: hypothetical protein GY835_16790 [bacterium]|nr:hypothetical protein [bacterium]
MHMIQSRLSLCSLLLLLLLAPLTPVDLQAAGNPPHVHNSDAPENGSRTLHLIEKWRAGHDGDEIFFGVIVDVLEGPDGSIYLLDQQLHQIFAYSIDGEYLHTFGREGEGPGEFIQPRRMFWTGRDQLAVVGRAMGHFPRLGVDGEPDESLVLKGPEGETNRMAMAWRVEASDDVLALSGVEWKVENGARVEYHYLRLHDMEGWESVSLMSRMREDFDYGNRSYDELKNYFCQWALGPDGLIYLAPERDRYFFEVRSASGELQRTFERDYVSRRRTNEDKGRIAAGAVMSIDGKEVKLKTRISDFDPCIHTLQVDDEERIWVQHARSSQDLPDDIFTSYDLFSTAGHYLEELNIVCDADQERDRLLMLGEDRFLLLKNLTGAYASLFGGGEDDEEIDEEIEPLQVIYLVPSD